MAVSTAYSPLVYNGNGSTTAFSVTFPFFSGTLLVTAIASTGVETAQTISTHYTVSGGTDANNLPATGTVTMLTAPATGTTLRIERVTPKTQATVYTNNDAFPAKTTEAAFDKLLLIAQEGVAGAYDEITGDYLQLNSAGATDFWDAEDTVIRNVLVPAEDDDAANKEYVDEQVALSAIGSANFTQAGSGATERTWQSKLRESWISITDFGAVGDGATNNQAAITLAIAASAGRWLYAPVDASGGDYAITSGTLTIPSTCTIVYEGGARIYESGGTISNSGCSFGFGGGDTGESGRNRVTRGLDINILGGNTGTAAVTEVAYNRVFVDADQFDSTTGGGSKTFGFQVQHEFGDSSTKGGRAALNSRLFQDGVTSASNTDRNYTALQGHVKSATGDGGGSGTELGAYFGVNGYAELQSGATFTRNLTGGEFNALVATGASTLYRSGIQIAGGGNVRGTTDAAVSVSNLGGSGVTWLNGIRFGAQNGAEALGADSTVIGVASPSSIAYLIDANGISFTSGILRATGISWTSTSFALTGAAVSASIAGTPATFVNNTDAATNIALSIQSDRATMAANDRVGLSFALSDTAGNQDEFGRIEILGSTVTSASEAGQMRFHVITGGSLSLEAILSATSFTPGANAGNSLGSTTTGWNGLHLGTLTAINWANGEITITPSDADTLVIAGAATEVDVQGPFRADSLRIDQAATAIGTGTKTISNAADGSTNFGKYFSFNLNGTTVYVPCGTVAPT